MSVARDNKSEGGAASADAMDVAPFPIDPKLLSHIPPPRREDVLATFRTHVALMDLSTAWTAAGSPDRFAPSTMELHIKRPAAEGAELGTVEHVLSNELKFKARYAVVMPLSVPGGGKPRAWFVGGDTLQLRDTLTSAIEQTISHAKPGCVPTALAYVADPPPMPESSPSRRCAAIAEPCLGDGRFIYVGFNDGCVRIFPADPLAAVKAHKSKFGTLDPYLGVELQKVHTGAITSIVGSPALTAPAGFKNGFPVPEECRRLVCVASMDSLVSVWDAAAVSDKAAVLHSRHMRLQQALRQGTAPHSPPPAGTVKHQPFFIGVRDAVPSADNRCHADVTRSFHLGLEMRPLFRLKGNVAAIRTMYWTHTTVVAQLPDGYSWATKPLPEKLPVARTPAPDADDLRDKIKHHQEDEIVNGDPKPTVQSQELPLHTPERPPQAVTPTDETASDTGGQGGVRTATTAPAAASKEQQPEPTPLRQCREVDLLVTGDDEGRITLWNLHDELRSAQVQMAQCKVDTECASSASFKGRGFQGSSVASRSGSVAGSVHDRSASVAASGASSVKPFIVSRTVKMNSVSALNAAKFGTTSAVQPRQSAHVLEFGGTSIVGIACDLPPFVTLGSAVRPDTAEEGDKTINDATEDDLLAAAANRLRCFIVFSDASAIAIAAKAIPRDAPTRPVSIGVHVLTPVPGRFLMPSFDIAWSQVTFDRRHYAASSVYHDNTNRLAILASSSGTLDVWDLTQLAVIAVVPEYDKSGPLGPAESLNAVAEVHRRFHVNPTAGSSHMPYVVQNVPVSSSHAVRALIFCGAEGSTNITEANIASDCAPSLEPLLLEYQDEIHARIEDVRKICESTASELLAERQYAVEIGTQAEAKSQSASVVSARLGAFTQLSAWFIRWHLAASATKEQRILTGASRCFAAHRAADVAWRAERRPRQAVLKAEQRRFKVRASENALRYCFADGVIQHRFRAWLAWASERRLARWSGRIGARVDHAVAAGRAFWQWRSNVDVAVKQREMNMVLGEKWSDATLTPAAEALAPEVSRITDTACRAAAQSVRVSVAEAASRFDASARLALLETSVYGLCSSHIIKRTMKPFVLQHYAWDELAPASVADAAPAPLPVAEEARRELLDALRALDTLCTAPHEPLDIAEAKLRDGIAAREAAAAKHNESQRKVSQSESSCADATAAWARAGESHRAAQAALAESRSEHTAAATAAAEAQTGADAAKAKLSELEAELQSLQQSQPPPAATEGAAATEGGPAPEAAAEPAADDSAKVARLTFQIGDQKNIITDSDAKALKARDLEQAAAARVAACEKAQADAAAAESEATDVKAAAEAAVAEAKEHRASDTENLAKAQATELDCRATLRDTKVATARWISPSSNDEFKAAAKALVVAADTLDAAIDAELEAATDGESYPFVTSAEDTRFISDDAWAKLLMNADTVARTVFGAPVTMDDLRKEVPI